MPNAEASNTVSLALGADDLELAAEALREKAGRGGEDAGRARSLAAAFEHEAARRHPQERPGRRGFAGKRFGPLVLWLTIGALVLSALISIVGLLTGSFSEAEGRVLLGVVSIWVFSLAFLAGVRAWDRGGATAVVGRATQALAAVSLAFSLALIVAWSATNEGLDRGFWGLLVITLCAAHASFLLGWDTRRDRSIRAVLVASLLTAGVLAALLMAVVAGYDDPGGGFWRAVGVFAILTALGDLVLPVLSRLRLSAARPGP